MTTYIIAGVFALDLVVAFTRSRKLMTVAGVLTLSAFLVLAILET